MKELIKEIKAYGIENACNNDNPLLETTNALEKCVGLQRAIIRYGITKEKLDHPERSDDFGIHMHLYAGKEVRDKITIKDAIGDIFITLVMLDMQNEGLFMLETAVEIHDCNVIRKPSTKYNAFNLSKLLIKDVINMQYDIKTKSIWYSEAHMSDILGTFRKLCAKYNYSVKECVQHAFTKKEEN